MLTGFTGCIPLVSKKEDEVTKAYLDHIYSSFGGSVKILTDNRTELKNTLQGSCLHTRHQISYTDHHTDHKGMEK